MGMKGNIGISCIFFIIDLSMLTFLLEIVGESIESIESRLAPTTDDLSLGFTGW